MIKELVKGITATGLIALGVILYFVMFLILGWLLSSIVTMDIGYFISEDGYIIRMLTVTLGSLVLFMQQLEN